MAILSSGPVTGVEWGELLNGTRWRMRANQLTQRLWKPGRRGRHRSQIHGRGPFCRLRHRGSAAGMAASCGSRLIGHGLPARHGTVKPAVCPYADWAAQQRPWTIESDAVARRSVRIARLASLQFKDTMIVVPVIAAIFTAFIGDLKDAAVILAIVALNGAIGCVQEFDASGIAATARLAAAVVEAPAVTAPSGRIGGRCCGTLA